MRNSWRWKILGREVCDTYVLTHKPFVAVFWHRHILLGSPYFIRTRIAVMISHSRDGEMLARALRQSPVRAIRGSSSHGGSEALSETLQWLREGWPVAFACDGPRGPRSVAKIGCVIAALRSGAPILPLSAAATRTRTIRSWDRTVIPHPKSTVALAFGKPIWVQPDASPAECETLRTKVEESLNALEFDCERALHSDPTPI
jgi:lysophospholipid acyltransferase (LPLAT)-like uncharacterized protein